MRKHVKYLTVLSMSALMAAMAPGMAQSALAASAGWVEVDGELRYQDSEGYYLTDTWKKRNNEWYYLNEDGFLTRSSEVDEYYVDESGKRITNQWIREDNDEEWDDEAPEAYWHYYGNDGKSVVSKWIEIDGNVYYFDEDGHMQTGKLELNGSSYYLGDEHDGVRKSGWVQLPNEDEDAEEEMVWHYFDKNGRMVMDQVDRKIDGAYYTFENGILQTGWYKLPAAASDEAETATASNAAPSISSYQYYEADGKRADGWYQMEGAPEISEEGEIFSFHFKKGVPCYAETGIQLFSIDSKRYAFNTRGEMQTGLQSVTTEDGTVGNFYFGDDGVMKIGKQTIYNEDLDENQTWFFTTDGGNKGRGFHGVRDNSVYSQGLRLEADRDLKYAPVELDGVTYLVNASGTLQKASSASKSSAKPELGKGFKDFTDAEDRIWTVDTNGIVQK